MGQSDSRETAGEKILPIVKVAAIGGFVLWAKFTGEQDTADEAIGDLAYTTASEVMNAYESGKATDQFRVEEVTENGNTRLIYQVDTTERRTALIELSLSSAESDRVGRPSVESVQIWEGPSEEGWQIDHYVVLEKEGDHWEAEVGYDHVQKDATDATYGMTGFADFLVKERIEADQDTFTDVAQQVRSEVNQLLDDRIEQQQVPESLANRGLF